MKTIEFYFDYVSPYAYLGWVRLRRLAGTRDDVEIVPIPILFAGLLNHFGTVGPAEVPARREMVFRDVLRCADRHDVPLQFPPTHPFNPLAALRVSLEAVAGEHQPDVVTALYDAVWGRGEAIDGVDRVAEVLEATGLSGAQLAGRTAEPDVKLALRDSTDAAIGRGVFGVPFFFVSDEPFWGQDRLWQVEQYLDGTLGYERARFEAGLSRSASAARRATDAGE